jgi:hypothetical protein
MAAQAAIDTLVISSGGPLVSLAQCYTTAVAHTYTACSSRLLAASALSIRRPHHSLGLMAMRVLAMAERPQVPRSARVPGPLFSLPSSGTRMAVCLQGRAFCERGLSR